MVVASLILSDPPMGDELDEGLDEGPVYCTVEAPAIQVVKPADSLPCWRIVYTGDGCVSRGEKNLRFWRRAMRDFGGAPELLFNQNKCLVLTATARSTAPREVNSQQEELTEMVSGVAEVASKSETVSGVDKNASKKKNKKNNKKRKGDRQRLQSHSAPQLSSAIGSSLKDDENSVATVGESGPSSPVLVSDPCLDTDFDVVESSSQGHNAEQLDFSSLRGLVCHTKIIRFMGRKYRILLQDENGPCSLIAISNFLILLGRITLPALMEVCLETVADIVFAEVFRNMKNEDYAGVVAALKQSATGLDIDILFSSVDGFEDTSQYRIFRILGIPLYHSCTLNLDMEEDAHTHYAIDGRTYNQLYLDHYKQVSMKQEAGPSVTSEEEDKFERIGRFLEATKVQSTDYGFCTLKKHTNDADLFVFFWNNHFSIIFKANGNFYNLQTDVGCLNSKITWQVFNNLDGDGDLLEEILILSNKDVDASIAPKALGKTQITPVESVTMSSKSIQNAPLPRGHFKTQFASFFTGSEHKKFEAKFLEFLRSYEENGIKYYRPIITAMKEMGCWEMFVFYEHIYSVDPQFAISLCMCYERVRNNLTNALHTFIQTDLCDPHFHSEHLSVRICDMPKPES
ncbi:ubiquitin carboxyl-terminal hydrolase MINDY-1 [Brachypodium distachyon]|uniref:ubiquitin carboxyl-terminal hydrolase MINDY-1 n=1 Tax=Brachypodium distachyon TaxID=15368 RepID=UPI000D0D020A|nr:ubiquitin carboxyl-terminal hydrolase MINDY-1 [Brachypodium distachyon]|eukprot:XP_024316444.1 ubiquitin carboxyl-terminal hydrolase MINDY-1 [Brachypodium distachyon]